MSFRSELNDLCSKRVPLFFVIDYKKTHYEIHPLDKLPKDIRFHTKNTKREHSDKRLHFKKDAISFDLYRSGFEKIREQIRCGNSYLLNFTAKTRLIANFTLLEAYEQSNSLFNLYFRDEFTCFTPERFVEIRENKIYAYPMKGTINSSIPDAKNQLLNSEKELAEHVMVVDLLRNDLGMVGKKVRLESFRHLDRIPLEGHEIFQTSSRISAELEKDWRSRVGDIFDLMLPAGSVTGTPKSSTCAIIDAVENFERGYFCGVAGIFDGEGIQSYVLIRFIEKKDGELYYKSGGGITIDSDPLCEYEEMLEKVYVPVF